MMESRKRESKLSIISEEQHEGRARSKTLNRNNTSKASSRYCQLLCLGVFILFTITLFSLPMILFYIEFSEAPQEPVTMAPPTSMSCSYANNLAANNTNCSSLSWGRVPSNCTAVPYTGSVCRDHLSTWQRCALGQADTVWVSDTQALMAAEANATTLTGILSSAASSACKAAAVPFVCQQLFPLCDCTSGVPIILPSRQSCLHISTDVCETEWQQVQLFGYGHLLPDCEKLPSTEYLNGNSGSGEPDSTNSTNNTTSTPVAITCRENFFVLNNTCHPICHLWEQDEHIVSVVFKSISIAAITVGVVCGILNTVLSVIQYKRMLVFPVVSIVYLNLGFCFFGMAGIISETAVEFFYCNSKSLLLSLKKPTVFCSITGVILQYFMVNMTLWWFVHVYFLFHKVMWPFHAKAIEQHQKWIHLMTFIFVTLLPLIAVLAVIISEDHEYTVGRFPPILCAPNSMMTFYSMAVPVDILCCAGVILLVIVFWIVHKHQGIVRQKQNAHILASTAEKKLFIILFYYFLFGVTTLLYITLSNSDFTDPFITGISNHFICESTGYTPGKCDRNIFQPWSLTWLFTVVLVQLGLLPIVSLVFVWDKKAIQRCFCEKKRQRKQSYLSTRISFGRKTSNTSLQYVLHKDRKISTASITSTSVPCLKRSATH